MPSALGPGPARAGRRRRHRRDGPRRGRHRLAARHDGASRWPPSSTPPRRSAGDPIAALRMSERRRAAAPPGRQPPHPHRARPHPLAGARRRRPTRARFERRRATTCAWSTPPDVAALLDDAGLRVTTMGRGPDEDPLFFRGRRRRRRPRRPLLAAARYGRRVSASEARAAAQPDGAAARRAPARSRPSEIQRAARATPRTRPRSGGPSSATRTSCGRWASRCGSSRCRARCPAVDGYRIPREEYALRDPGLTTDELAALHLAASAVQVEGLPATDGPAEARRAGHRRAPDDLGRPRGPAARRPEPGARCSGPSSSRTPVRPPLPRARSARVDPYRLEFQRGRWYLRATTTCATRSGTSASTASRATSRSLDGPAFEPPATDRRRARPAAPGSWAPRRPCEPACASTARRRAGRCSTSGPTTWCDEEADGSVVVELPVTNRAAFRSFVLSLPRPRRGARAARAARRPRRPGWRRCT